MKFRRLLVFCFLVFYILSFISQGVLAQTSGLDSIEENLDNLETNIEDKKDTIESFGDEEKWQLLGDGWRDLLLKTTVFQMIDEFFTKISPVFFVIVGTDYEFSFDFFFALFYFIFFVLILMQVCRESLPFNRELGALTGLVFSIILAQFNFYTLLSSLTFKFIFFRGGAWGWGWTIVYFIIYLFLLFNIKKFIVNPIIKIIKGFKGESGDSEKDKAKEVINKLDKFEKGFEEGFKEGSGI